MYKLGLWNLKWGKNSHSQLDDFARRLYEYIRQNPKLWKEIADLWEKEIEYEKMDNQRKVFKKREEDHKAGIVQWRFELKTLVEKEVIFNILKYTCIYLLNYYIQFYETIKCVNVGVFCISIRM
jgi:hypothetical protein